MEKERPCPECGAPIPSLVGYPDWCGDCGWNLLRPPSLAGGAGRFARLTESLGRRSGDRLATELRTAGELRPRLTAAKLGAYVIAAGVHLFTLVLLAGGVAAIVLEPDVVSILIGLAMISAGLSMRPRVPRQPEGTVLEAGAAPALHALVGRVADALGRPAPEMIIADSRWNASWALVGWRRRRVLVVGVPVLAALEPQERVAMIAHEVGHDRNGDVSRGVFVGSAVNGLDSLSDILRPPRARPDVNLGMYEWMTGGLMWVVTRPIDWLLWLEARLLLRDMQRAEYLADAEAAGVAGTTAVIAMHERLLLYPTFQHAVQQAAQADDANGTVSRVRETLRSVPERERERRRRVARLERARLEDTHPPTGMRIALLEERSRREPKVALHALDSARIDAEFAALEPSVGRDLIDRYRTSLHHG